LTDITTPSEVSVQLRHDRRPFADGRSDPLHRSATNVADGEMPSTPVSSVNGAGGAYGGSAREELG
jgi:hypothetical protein